MISQDEIKERIIEVAPEDIDLIVVFGSQARGTATEMSDLDIAIGASGLDRHERFDLRLRAISQFEGPRQDVDVVLMQDINWSLKYRIARDGNVLYDRTGNKWACFVESVLKYYPDYRIFQERFLNDSLKGVR
ncbi:MAG: nucleotidyltransferase domain-containing protein [Candidatus Thorarchaeota archaeon]|nr:nucleotidyltransferase domain-containing protein [Candidatus Thorarchaeota archaeon]